MSEYESNPKVFRTNRQNLTRMIQSSKSNEDDSMKNYTTPYTKSQDKSTASANPQPVRQDGTGVILPNNLPSEIPRDPLISYFQPRSYAVKSGDISISEFHRRISNPRQALVEQTAKCRRYFAHEPVRVNYKCEDEFNADFNRYEQRKKRYTRAKNDLPLVTLHGTAITAYQATDDAGNKLTDAKGKPIIIGRGSDGMETSSGLVSLDIDKFPTEAEVRAVLEAAQQHPSVLLTFTSASGMGCRIVVRTNVYTRNNVVFKRAFNHVASVFIEVTGRYPDEDAKDISRLCYVPADLDAYINLDAVPLEIPADALVATPDESKEKSEYSGERQGDDVVRDALRYISADKNRTDWVAVGASLFHSGYRFEIFDEWSRGSDKYDATEMNRTWASLERKAKENTDDKVRTVGSIFKEAKDNGWIMPAQKKHAARASDKIVVDKNFKRETITMEAAQAQNMSDFNAYLANILNKSGKHACVWNSAAGTGKTHVSTVGIDDLAGVFVYQNNDLTDEAHKKALEHEIQRIKNASYDDEDERASELENAENTIYRWRSRMWNHDEDEQLPLGLGDNERSCIQPDLCNRYAERGLTPQIVCATCPELHNCIARGYLSQGDIIKRSRKVFTGWTEELVVDRRYANHLKRFTSGKGKSVVVVEEARAGNITQKREMLHEDVAEMIKNQQVAAPEGAVAHEHTHIVATFLRSCESAVCLTYELSERFEIIKQAINDAVESMYRAEIVIPKSKSEKKRESKLKRNIARIVKTKDERLRYVEIIDRCLAERQFPYETDVDVIKRILAYAADEFELDDERVSLDRALSLLYQIKRKADGTTEPGAEWDLDEEKRRVDEWADRQTAKHNKKNEQEAEASVEKERRCAAIEYLDHLLESIPVYLKFNRNDDTGDLSVTIKSQHGTHTASVLGKGEVSDQPFINFETIDAERVQSQAWSASHISYRQAIHAGVVDAGNPPKLHSGFVSDIHEFIETHPNVEHAPCSVSGKGEKLGLKYELIPTLNHSRVIFITASDVYGHIGQAFAGTDVDVTYLSCGLPAFKQGSRVFQITGGKYISGRSLTKVVDNDDDDSERVVVERDLLKEAYENVIKPSIDAGTETLVVAEKIVIKTEVGKLLDEAGVLENHKTSEGVNTYEDADLAVIFHHEPPPPVIEAYAKRIHRHDNLSFDRDEVEISEGGVTYTGMGYTDERVQRVYKALCAGSLMQAIMRLRPNRHEYKTMIVFSCIPIPMLPVVPIPFRRADLHWLRELIQADTATAFQIWGSRDDRIVELNEKGMPADDIADLVGVSERHVYRIIERHDQQKNDTASEATAHVESPHRPASDMSHKGVLYAACHKTADSDHNVEKRCDEATCPANSDPQPQKNGIVPETADEATAHVESPHSNSYHKDVGSILSNIMSDGKERRTSEIVSLIDASPSIVKSTLKKKEKSGEILKVRHGVYLIAGADVDTTPEKDEVKEMPASQHVRIFNNVAMQSELDEALEKMKETHAQPSEPEHASEVVGPSAKRADAVDSEDSRKEVKETERIWIVPMRNGRAVIAETERDANIGRRVVNINIAEQLPSLENVPSEPCWVEVDAWELLKTGFFKKLLETEVRSGR